MKHTCIICHAGWPPTVNKHYRYINKKIKIHNTVNTETVFFFNIPLLPDQHHISDVAKVRGHFELRNRELF